MTKKQTKTTSNNLHLNAGKNKNYHQIITDLQQQLDAASKSAENEKKHHELIAMVFKSAKIGVWDWYIQENRLEWSDEMLNLFGVKKSDFGGAYEDFMDCVHPDDKQSVTLAVQKSLQNHTLYVLTYRIVLPKRKVKYIRAIGGFFQGYGKLSDRLTGICLDVTQQKKSEEDLQRRVQQEMDKVEHEREQRLRSETLFKEDEALYKTILNYVTDGWWDWNLETDDEYLSPSFKALFGYRDNELPNKAESWQKIIYPEDKKVAIKAFQEHTDKGKPYNIPVRYHHKDGSTVWVICRGHAIRDQDGKFRRMVGTHTDITRIKQIEQELQQQHNLLEKKVTNRTKDLQETNQCLRNEMRVRESLQEQLLQSQKLEALGQLAGGVAHDFNNLLTSMLGYSNLIQMHAAEKPELQNLIAKLDKSINRASAITNKLLTFSRKSKLEKVSTDLLEIINESCDLLEHSAKDKVNIEIHSANNLYAIEADQNALSQIFVNLGINAIDAMPKGGQLTISLDNLEVTATNSEVYPELQMGAYVVCKFADTGSGIDAATMNKIFDPFYTSKATGKGTGLGLALVYGIIEQHQGLIQVQSEVGKGTCFTLYFPVKITKHND